MSIETKTILFETAIQLIARHGVSETSVANVAKHAKVSKGALYHHFSSKDDLLIQLHSYVMHTYTPISKLLDISNVTASNYKKRLESFFEVFEYLKKKHPIIIDYSWEFSHYAKRNPHLIKSISTDADVVQMNLFIKKGIDLGIFKKKYSQKDIFGKLLVVLKGIQLLEIFNVTDINYKKIWKITIEEVCE